MIATTKAAGMIAVVLPHGALFRDGIELTIRANIVKSDLFEVIIELPTGIVPGASIPSAVCILNKAKIEDHWGKLLFINASRENGLRAGRAGAELTQMERAAIGNALRDFQEIPHFARVVDLAEVEQHDFILIASRYTEAGFHEQRVDLPRLVARLQDLERERDQAEHDMDQLLVRLRLVP